MTTTELLMLSEGFTNGANTSLIEISRLPINQTQTHQREIVRVAINDVINPTEEVVLQPFDHVIVRKNIDYVMESSIQVVGEVIRPGPYPLLSKNEKLADLIARSGGITQWANQEEAIILRRTEFFNSEANLQQRLADLSILKSNLDSNFYSSDELMAAQLEKDYQRYTKALVEGNDQVVAQAKKDRLLEIKNRNPLLRNLDINKVEAIPVQLDKALASLNSVQNIILEEGDILILPKLSTTVRLRGQVLYPHTVQHTGDHSARYYVNKSGGFDTRAKRRHTYVVYANGEVARTTGFLFFKNYPKVKSGADVIVPVKTPKIPLRPGEVASLTTGLAALIAVISQVTR
jgi:protein involved in polysaccharide export with SLBB domain